MEWTHRVRRILMRTDHQYLAAINDPINDGRVPTLFLPLDLDENAPLPTLVFVDPSMVGKYAGTINIHEMMSTKQFVLIYNEHQRTVAFVKIT